MVLVASTGSFGRNILFVLFALLLVACQSLAPSSGDGGRRSSSGVSSTTRQQIILPESLNSHFSSERAVFSRRQWFQTNSLAAAVALTSGSVLASPQPSLAVSSSSTTTTTPAAEVTDKVFLEIKGLPAGTEDTGSTVAPTTTRRIVIGLFGKEAPESVRKLKSLMSRNGLPAACKAKEERVLQREQLEANKVYNSCIEGQEKGVTYDYAQIWRIVQGERIDFGSVAGKFVAREYPDWQERSSSSSALKHDRPGIVSVRRGNESGFGFTVYPGGAGGSSSSSAAAASDLNENHIVVGQVLEGLDVIEQLNNIPVITSSKVNYMGLTGGTTTKSAPNRSCRYGGPMYCNENKPLSKLTIYQTGEL